MNKEELNYLNGKWTHSFEEDSGSEIVYRPSDHVFPRSRGRAQLHLQEGGEAHAVGIGRDDVPAAVRASWEVKGDQLSINYPDGQRQVYKLKQVKVDKLVLTR